MILHFDQDKSIKKNYLQKGISVSSHWVQILKCGMCFGSRHPVWLGDHIKVSAVKSQIRSHRSGSICYSQTHV